MFGLNRKVPSISAEQLNDLIDKNEKITIIDVRTPQEISRGKIENSINIPLDQIQNAGNILKDKNAPMYVYCLSGSRSAAAVERLINMGYINAINVTSGLLAWRIKYPLV